MGRAPARDRSVYFVGAGVSVAYGLPNTAMLLEDVLSLAEDESRWKNELLQEKVLHAFEFFYPDAVNDGYRPEVVDFFAALNTYIEVGTGLPGGFKDAPHLQRLLKSAIAVLLVKKIRECDSQLASQGFLAEMVRPGNIVISSNWDLLVERYAQKHGVPVRLSKNEATAANELTLLKLHGSVDWCLGKHFKRQRPDSDFAVLQERQFGNAPRRALPAPSSRRDSVFRVRAMESWSKAIQFIGSRAGEPFMVTMGYGKTGQIGPLRDIWKDAYDSISRAHELKIAGYAMPPDDIEIRTLLRAGVERGNANPQVSVLNPAPDVHERIRRYLDRGIRSNYRGV